MTRLAIIDYGSGNVRSVQRALEATAARQTIGLTACLTDDPDTIAAADRIILPGVGHFADCAAGLARRSGLTEALREAVFARGRPFLGICVGMQLLAEMGREDADTPGLGWIPGVVERLTPSDPALPVPHMGWNTLCDMTDHPVLTGLGGTPHVYFVHSYALIARNPGDVAARCDYGGAFTAALARETVFGVQFHPEKSQEAGQRLLANFLRWTP